MRSIETLAAEAARALELIEVQRERIVVHRRWWLWWPIGVLVLEIVGVLLLFR